MTIHIHVDSMKSAEHLSSICKDYSNELYLRSEKFCIDPKSTLGILAMMYSARDTMYLDTGDLDDKDLPKFLKELESAGLQKIIDEKAAQFADWKKENGVS